MDDETLDRIPPKVGRGLHLDDDGIGMLGLRRLQASVNEGLAPGEVLMTLNKDNSCPRLSINLETILEVRNLWRFYRDRRPEMYGAMVELLP